MEQNIEGLLNNIDKLTKDECAEIRSFLNDLSRDNRILLLAKLRNKELVQRFLV